MTVGAAGAAVPAPRIRVTSGNPGPDEIAAVTVALLALAAGSGNGPDGSEDLPVAWQAPDVFQSPWSWAG